MTTKILQDAADLQQSLQSCGVIGEKEVNLPVYSKIEQMALKTQENTYKQKPKKVETESEQK